MPDLSRDVVRPGRRRLPPSWPDALPVVSKARYIGGAGVVLPLVLDYEYDRDIMRRVHEADVPWARKRDALVWRGEPNGLMGDGGTGPEGRSRTGRQYCVSQRERFVPALRRLGHNVRFSRREGFPRGQHGHVDLQRATETQLMMLDPDDELTMGPGRGLLARRCEASYRYVPVWRPVRALAAAPRATSSTPRSGWVATALRALPRANATAISLDDFGEPMSLEAQLQYKYILVLQGNDVASNVKWALRSSSVVVMPTPTVESFVGEGRLKPWVHYLPLAAPEQADRLLAWARTNEHECQRIVLRANAFMRQLRVRDVEWRQHPTSHHGHERDDAAKPPSVDQSEADGQTGARHGPSTVLALSEQLLQVAAVAWSQVEMELRRRHGGEAVDAPTFWRRRRSTRRCGSRDR